MSFFGSVVDELDVALRSGSPGRRTEVLRRVTGFFLNDAEKLSENQISLFDDVMTRLIEEIEVGAQAELSARLAQVPQAPRTVIRKLASSDAIEIARPILEQSERLTDQDLVEIAKTKGQAHQLSIAGRSHLNEAVTDALIDRCDVAVANKIAGNSGARISNTGFSKLAMLAEGNDQLTETVAKRVDISPRLFRELLSRATATVQQTLLASAPPSARDGLKRILSDISGQIGVRVTANHYAEAQRYVSAFSQDTALCRKKLVEFANAKIVGKTVATLSLLSAVPIDLIDRLMHEFEPLRHHGPVQGFGARLGNRLCSHGCASTLRGRRRHVGSRRFAKGLRKADGAGGAAAASLLAIGADRAGDAAQIVRCGYRITAGFGARVR